MKYRGSGTATPEKYLVERLKPNGVIEVKESAGLHDRKQSLSATARHIRLCFPYKGEKAFFRVLEAVATRKSITERVFKFQIAFKSDNL